MMKNDSQILLAADHFAIVFPYNAEQVASVKRIPGAKWDKLARTWRVPLSSIHETKEFANEHRFWLDPDIAGLTNLPEKPEPALVDVHRGTVRIRFGYDEVRIASIKRVPGTKWDSKRRYWAAPLGTIGEVVDWADDFRIAVSEEARNLVGATKTKKTGLFALSNLTELQNPVETSRLNGELFPFQHVPLKYALETRRCFIADVMGLGKTVVSLAAIEIGAGGPAVVVCPPTLVLNWVSEINHWLPGRNVVSVSGMAKKAHLDQIADAEYSQTQALADWDENADSAPRHLAVTPQAPADETAAALGTADFIVIGYSTIGAWQPALSRYASSLICDESQYAKNGKAKRTKAVIKLAKGLPDDGMILCLTGTPILNRPAEFASQLKILGQLNNFGGEWNFYKRYCNAFKDRWGTWHLEGSSHREELNKKLRSTCYVRRLKEDVLSDLAPVRHQTVYVEGDPKVMKEYAKAERDIAKYMAQRAAEIAEELGLNPRSAAVIARIKAESAEHIVRLSALRRLAALAKVKAIDEMVQTHVDEGSKVVIAGHHREVVSGLADKYGGYRIQGGMKVEEVERFKSEFQTKSAEEVPVIVLSIQAAKTGHTLTAAQDIILAELPWTPADADQVIARLHRIGQEGSVLATWVLTSGTIDLDIYDLLAEKRKVVDAVTDGIEPDDSGDVVGNLLAKFALAGLGEL